MRCIQRTRLGVFPMMYLPMGQANLFGSGFAVTAKLVSDCPFVEHSLTEALRRQDPQLAFSFRDYGAQVRATMAQERLVAMLSGFFGVLAMLLAALGLYGVASYSVNRRRPELALRMALGAERRRRRATRTPQSRRWLRAAHIGIVLSLWAASSSRPPVWCRRADPLTLAGTASILALVGLFAAWLPARKASRVDPAITLKG